MKFIDLFAGIGGFHCALSRLGHKCVFASELSEELCELYQKNHGIKCFGDITKLDIKEIPSHDILCAGFPCQSFSKAGKQKGMKEARGQLFDEIVKILSYHKPRYIILENVKNLLTHNDGMMWSYVEKKLQKLGYFVDKKILSPHYINIPQHRERLFIVASLKKNDVRNMEWPAKQKFTTSVNCILSRTKNTSDLEPEKRAALDVWLDFLNDLPKGVSPYRPLWSMEFNATYPTSANWGELSLKDWKKYTGAFGFPLSKCKSIEEVQKHLPNYVVKQKGFTPEWKQRIIQNNRDFYSDFSDHIKTKTLNAISRFERESWKKFEWNCPEGSRCYDDKLIQFRGSGVRIKHNTYLPSLVTVVTQIPIVGKYKRYILPKEGARAQSLPSAIKLPKTRSSSFRVLGNMVNVEVAYRVASSLIG